MAATFQLQNSDLFESTKLNTKSNLNTNNKKIEKLNSHYVRVYIVTTKWEELKLFP